MSVLKKTMAVLTLIFIFACGGSSTTSSVTNQPPDMVPLYFPRNGENLSTKSVTLIWGRSFDPEGGKVTYNLYFQKDNPVPALYKSGLTTTTFDVGSLEAGSYYFWKVVAVDDMGNETESETYYFRVVSDSNTPPTKPILVSPQATSIVYDLPVKLEWKPSFDPDGDRVTYTVMIGTTPQDLSPLTNNITGSTYLIDDLQRGKGYYWRVMADDGKGGVSFSDIYYFQLNILPWPVRPLYPVGITSPLPGEYTNNIPEITIYWNSVTSPNGGDVYYYFTIGSRPDLSDATTYGPMSENHVTIPLNENTTYYLKITAEDQYGGRNESPLQWFFNSSPSASFDGRFKYLFMGGSMVSGGSYPLQFRSLGCGISYAGDIWCWGDDSELKLLNGIWDYSIFSLPAFPGNIVFTIIFSPPRRMLLPPWVKYSKVGLNIGNADWFGGIAMGAALSEEGELFFWTNHYNYDQFVITPYPVRDPAGGNWKDFSVRSYGHICAIDTENYLYCWGDNSHKQTGNPDGVDWVDTPYQVVATDTTHWKSVTVGYLFTCAISLDHQNKIYCWGNNDWGQLGISAGGDFSYPIPITGQTDWKKISAGMDNICALDINDNLFCWGRNSYGESGAGESAGDKIFSPFQIEADSVTFWKDFFMGFRSVCALDQDDSLWCWGANALGGSEEGYAILMTTGTSYFTPLKVMNNFDLTSVSIGATTGCGLKDGALWCWGDRGNFFFGDHFFYGLFESYTLSDYYLKVIASHLTFPEEVQHPYGFKWKYFNISNWSSCGIDGSDNMWCWGQNGNGNLGTGNSDSIDYPALVQGGIRWRSVTFSESFSDVYGRIPSFYNWTCGISTDDRLYCWGANDHGQLGTGNTSGSDHPVEVVNSLDTSWREVAAGNDHTCAIDENGVLWCWGNNDMGEVGQSDTGRDYLEPVSFASGITKWTDVTAGYKFTCAIDEGGNTYCWGNNDHYIFGVTWPETSYMPVTVATPDRFVKLSAGLDHVCGLTVSGDIYCWGANQYGQLGRGETSDDSSDLHKIDVPDGTHFVSINCTGHSCSAEDSSGRGWFWGREFVEELFNAPRFNSHPEPMIDTVFPVENMGYMASETHRCYLGVDGGLNCWGSVAMDVYWSSVRYFPIGVGVRYRFRPVKVDFYFR